MVAVVEPNDVVVDTWDIDADIQRLLLTEAGSGPALLVLPRELDGADGIYDEDAVAVPKELQAEGVPARFLHADPEHRRFAAVYSSEVVLAFVVGILGNLTTDGCEAVYRYVRAAVGRRRGDDPNLRVAVKIAFLKTKNGTRVEGLTITGPSAGVAERVLAVLTRTDDD